MQGGHFHSLLFSFLKASITSLVFLHGPLLPPTSHTASISSSSLVFPRSPESLPHKSMAQLHGGEPRTYEGHLTFPCVPFPTLFPLALLLATPVSAPFPVSLSSSHPSTCYFLSLPHLQLYLLHFYLTFLYTEDPKLLLFISSSQQLCKLG